MVRTQTHTNPDTHRPSILVPEGRGQSRPCLSLTSVWAPLGHPTLPPVFLTREQEKPQHSLHLLRGLLSHMHPPSPWGDPDPSFSARTSVHFGEKLQQDVGTVLQSHSVFQRQVWGRDCHTPEKTGLLFLPLTSQTGEMRAFRSSCHSAQRCFNPSSSLGSTATFTSPCPLLASPGRAWERMLAGGGPQEGQGSRDREVRPPTHELTSPYPPVPSRFDSDK